MSPESASPGSVRPAARSAAVVNEEIRALWRDPRVPLTDEQRARRDELYVEWAAARRAEIVEAA